MSYYDSKTLFDGNTGMLVKPFVIENVIVENDERFELVSPDGRKLVFQLYGDCCSSSFFDDNTVLDVKGLLGDTLLEIQRNGVFCPNPEDCCEKRDRVEYDDHSVVILKTNTQSISLFWRNVSNGYYSGWCTISEE